LGSIIETFGRGDNRGRIGGELALIPESFSDSGYNSPKLKDVFYLLVMNLLLLTKGVFYLLSESASKN